MYSKNLKSDDRNWSYKECHDYKYKFGLSVGHVPEEFKDNPELENGVYKISGIHSYDILLNPIYSEAFQYVSM